MHARSAAIGAMAMLALVSLFGCGDSTADRLAAAEANAANAIYRVRQMENRLAAIEQRLRM